MSDDNDVDVVVIGSGAAGLCAALMAHENGARAILVAEAEDVVGGSSRLSGGVVMGSGSRLQKAAGIEDQPDDLLHDYMQLNQWDVHYGAVSTFTRRSGETVDWLADHGVRFFDRLVFGGDERLPRSHCVDGAGQAVIDVLHSRCRDRGIDIALRRRVDRLIIEGGRVVGAQVGDDRITAGAVVIASGGFGANPDLLASRFPSAWHKGFTWYIGSDGARGDALGFAEQAGAQVVGHNRGLRTLTPAFGRLNEAFLPGWTMLLDPSGRRFADETAPYGILDGLVAAHGNAGFVLFDDAALRPPAELAERYRDSYKQVWPNHPPFRSRNYNADIVDEMVGKGRIASSDTFAGLAERIGVDPDVLVGEVERYNSHAEAGEDRDFGKSGKFLMRIGTPPFFAAAVRPATVNLTGCGLRIDGRGRVLDERGSEIAGLFAAGECTGGVLGTRYMGSGNGMANALTMGRVAGESAARNLNVRA